MLLPNGNEAIFRLESSIAQTCKTNKEKISIYSTIWGAKKYLCMSYVSILFIRNSRFKNSKHPITFQVILYFVEKMNHKNSRIPAIP